MRKLWNNTHADLDIILGAVIVMVMLALSIVVVFSVVGSFDMSDLDTLVDANYNDPGAASTLATNATNSVTDNLNTFYTIAPILLIVMAAVGILGYVMLLRRE